VSDIHIENNDNRFDEYKFVYDKLAKKIKEEDTTECVLCIAGDLIDFKDNVTLCGIKMLIYFLQYFGNICDVVIISGNHDVNTKNVNEIDLIECCYDKLSIAYDIYYLKQSGLYKMNNIIFSIASVFDKKIIDVKKIKKKDEICVAMHHGYVIADKVDIKKLPFVLKEDDFFRANMFKKYDITLLGDIHKCNFITKNIAYCSSLIQRNFGEPIDGHGFIKWNIETREGKFNEIISDYGHVTASYKNGKLEDKARRYAKNTC
jgi:DNA repair exonuclease SbcCD nuclease subunit